MKPRLSGVIGWVVAATWLAAFSRWFWVLTFPPQAWVDEIWFALRARDLLNTGQFQVFYKTFWGGVNPMLVNLTALAQALGFSRVIVASRAVSTTFGVLSVPLAFACLSEFWRGAWPTPRRRWLAALAAIVLSNFYLTVDLSRIGTEPAVALAAGLFCIWQMRRAVRTGHWASWLLAGGAAGWAQYISPHARFILPLLALFGLHDLWMAPPSQRTPLLLRFGALAVTAVIVALPLIAFFAQEPEWFLGRARTATEFVRQRGWASAVLENTRLVALSFSVAGDLNARDNLSGRPLLDLIQSVGFYLGLGWAFVHLRRSARARELLVWLGVMLTPSLLTDNAPSFSRLIGAAPPIAALMVTGWGAVWDWAKPRLGRQVRLGLAGALIVTSLAINAYDYFVRYRLAPQLRGAFAATPVNLAHDLGARAQTEAVFVQRLAEAEDVYAFDFLFPGTRVQRMDFLQCLPLADRRAARTTYLVLTASDPLTAPELQRAFPSATLTPIEPEEASLMGRAALIEVPPGAPLSGMQAPAHMRFGPGMTLLGYDLVGQTVSAGQSIFVTLYWKAEALLDADWTAFAHLGTGLTDSANIAQRDGQPCQGYYPTSRWQAGDVVPDRFAITVPPDAPPGAYPLAVGWYRYPSLERAPLIDAEQPLPDNRAVLTAITVTAP